jgi:uncharacterized protein (PEP-CTERM system associated)
MIGAAAGLRSNTRCRTDLVVCTRLVALAALLSAGPSFAQLTPGSTSGQLGGGSSGVPSWRIVPTISISETLTDNVALAPDNRKESDLITRISPGVRLEKPAGRLKLNLNYQMQGLLYANNSDSNDIQNYLNASGTLEAIRNWFFIDARANISQQVLSPFGVQSNVATENINQNRAETLAYQLSPYIKGRMGATTEYQLRYTYSASSVRGSTLGDTQVQDMVGLISGRPNPYGFGWTLNASYQGIHTDGSRDVNARRVGGSVLHQFTPQFRTSLLGGWESNNYSTSGETSSATYGVQAEWLPTDRTRVNALAERRPSIDTHQFSFSHRSRRTAWHFSDFKSVTTLANQLNLGQVTTAFDLFFNALTSQFPDPLARAAAVERLLQQSGIPRDLAVATFFVTSRAIVQRSRQASVALLGVRNTVTLAGTLTDSRSLESILGAPDEFSRTAEIEQRSLTASWAHQLSPLTSFNLIGTQTRSTGGSGSGAETTQNTVQLLLTHRFGPKTFGTLGARYINFDSGVADDFREKALTGSFVVTF